MKAYWKDNFRPALASFCCEAVGGQPEVADDVSLMVTLLSAGGGIHDDIVDQSLNKHFRMTILGLHGLDAALLVGDLLIIKGWAMVREIVKKTSDFKRTAEVIEVFGNWTRDVCEAEFMETLCRRNLDTSIDSYQKILRKSMADTEACARLGAIVGGGSVREVEALAEFGGLLGLSFRLTDDVKDTVNVEGNLSSRLESESVPLPILYAAQSNQARYAQIKSVLNKSIIDQLDCKKLLELCVEAQAFEFVLKKANQNAASALNQLSMLRDTNTQRYLTLLIDKSITDLSSFCLNLL